MHKAIQVVFRCNCGVWHNIGIRRLLLTYLWAKDWYCYTCQERYRLWSGVAVDEGKQAYTTGREKQ